MNGCEERDERGGGSPHLGQSGMDIEYAGEEETWRPEGSVSDVEPQTVPGRRSDGRSMHRIE